MFWSNVPLTCGAHISYIIIKLTREGKKLGSRMGVGVSLRIPKLLGLALIFLQTVFKILNDMFRIFFYFIHDKIDGLKGI